MRNPWIIAQLAAAAVLLVISLIGILGTSALGLPELAFSFAGAIQAFFVFPGLVISLVVNALIMRLHREIGVSTAEKVLLIVEGVLILALLVFHFYTDPAGDTLGFAFFTWPMLMLVATAIAIIAGARNATRPTAGPAAPAAPASAADPA